LNSNEKVKKVQITLPESVVRDFKATAAKEGTFMQEIGARLIYEYLRKHGFKYPDYPYPESKSES